MAQLLKFPLHSSASGKLTQALLCLTQQYQCSCVAVGATCCSAVPNPDIGQNGQLRTTPTTPRPGLLWRQANSSSRQCPKLLRRPTEPGEGWVGGGSRQSVRLPRAGNPSNPSDSDCRGEPAIRCREPAIRAIRVAPIAAANRQSVRLPRAGNPKPSMSSPAGRALSGSR